MVGFFLKGLGEGLCVPKGLAVDVLEPDVFRAELDVLYLARFATVSRPIRQTTGQPVMTWVLQVVATHLAVEGDEQDGDDSDFGTSRSMISTAKTGEWRVA